MAGQKGIEVTLDLWDSENVDRGTGDMEKDWDHRARTCAPFFIECNSYATEKELNASGERDLKEIILRRIDLNGRSRVLEIGCGTGRLLKPLSYLVQEAYG